MHFALLVLLVAVGVTAQGKSEDRFDTFEDFKKKQGIKYNSGDEEAYRKSVYSSNIEKIKANNANPSFTHKEGVNQFTIYTQEEFVSIFLGAKPPKTANVTTSTTSSTPTLGATWAPIGMDLTTRANYITPVKNQGSCGSCYAFATVAAIESINFISKGIAGSDFSEQQIVSCSQSYGNLGCRGGWTINVYNYVRAKGLTSEFKYPYTSGKTGANGTCLYDSASYKIGGSITVNATCTALAQAVLSRPISVAVDATNWYAYSSGIFSNCNRNFNHAVLLVGVTSSAWKIKNSWGTGWGQLGYILLSAANGNSTCGVCQYGSYPVA